ncbi:immunoglobulin I-set domain protein, partial [Teladorsagia circumcincta]
MVLKTLYIIELTDTHEGGLELVDPSWCPEEGGPPRKKVKSPPAISPTDEDGFFALTIDPVQVEDTGRYTCMATNEYGQASTSAFFRVLKVEKEAAPPRFINALKDRECKEGDVINFECEVRFISEDGICILIIKDVTRHFDGTVTCQGSNRLGTTSCDGRLKVRVPPTPPSFAKALEDRVVQENAV